MSAARTATRTILAAVVLLLTVGCSVTVPESRAPALGALLVGETTEGTRALGDPPSGSEPLNRARQLLPKVNLQPWQEELPKVVQSSNKDMQCSIGAESAACHLLTEVTPRPADIHGNCPGPNYYHGGYAEVTLESGAQYGRCGDGLSPMEAEAVAGPDFPGPWLQDGQTVRVGNMVCERTPGTISCAHLETGHGFLMGQDAYELW